MKESKITKKPDKMHLAQSDESTDLYRFLYLLRKRAWLISLSVAFFSLVAVAYALFATPMYRASVILAPTQGSDQPAGLGALAAQFGGLASLAGVSVGGEAKKNQTLAVLRSRRFSEEFIKKHQLMPLLFADEWNERTADWKSLPEAEIPTMGDAYEKFDSDIRVISEDKQSGLISVSIVWKDRFLAAEWANSIVTDVNAYLRQLAIEESRANISYLNSELDRTNYVELRKAIFRLIQQQVEVAMLANTQKEYAFRVLDPATVSDADDRYWPARAIICIFGATFGMLFGIAITLLIQAVKPIKLP